MLFSTSDWYIYLIVICLTILVVRILCKRQEFTKIEEDTDWMFPIIVVLIGIIAVISLADWFIKARNIRVQLYNDEAQKVASNAPNSKTSAKLLSEIKKRLTRLLQHVLSDKDHKKQVKLLKKRFRPQNIQEKALGEKGTSYTVNKGSEIHLCLREKDTLDHHDINILMFVAIHEMAHIMSKSYGHNDEFNRNFKYLLEQAVDIGVYEADNYFHTPKSFCGMVVQSTPLYKHTVAAS